MENRFHRVSVKSILLRYFNRSADTSCGMLIKELDRLCVSVKRAISPIPCGNIANIIDS